MTEQIAIAIDALEQFDVQYELTPMDTVIEADDVQAVFEAAAAAHEAAGDGRIITSLSIDDQGNREQGADDRVAAVEEELGRPAKSDH